MPDLASSAVSVALGTYIRIAGLSIKPTKNFRPSSSLDVSIDYPNHLRKSAEFVSRDEQLYRWSLEPSLNLFPKRKLLIHVRASRIPNPFQASIEPKVVEIKAEDILERFLGRGDMSREGPLVFTHMEQLQRRESYELSLTCHICTFGIADDDDTDGASPIRFTSPMHARMDIYEGVNTIRPVLDRIGPAANAMDVVLQVSRVAGEANPIVKIVVTALEVPYKMLQNEKEFSDDLLELGRNMQSLMSCLKALKDTQAAQSDILFEPLEAIMETILEAAQFVRSHLRKTDIGKIIASQFRENLNDLKSDFHRLERNFNLALNAYVVAEQAAERERATIRTALRPVKHKRIRSKCMEGTRVEILNEVDEWLRQIDATNILWLTGAPGAGKSAIMSTLVARYGARCAHIFLSKDVQELSDPLNIWPTLAYDLVERFPSFRPFLLNAVQGSLIQDADIDSQFESLIKNPLIRCGTEISSDAPIVVIDGLDEVIAQEKFWNDLLSSIRSWSALPRHFKLIVSSRDYPAIGKELQSVGRIIRLHTGSDDQVDITTKSDVRKYLEHRMSRIASANQMTPGWPGPAAIEELTRLTGGLFAWAEVATEYIRRGNCKQRLRDVIRTGNIVERGQQDGSPIDRLYEHILNVCFQNLSEREAASLRSVLAILVLAKEPLSQDDLRDLISEQVLADLRSFINNLHPLIPLEDTGEGKRYRVCHTTFLDYILKQPTSISTSDTHQHFLSHEFHSSVILIACLALLNKKGVLKYNICMLETSHLRNTDIPRLEERIDYLISSSVRYASRFWVAHLQDTVQCNSQRLEALGTKICTQIEHFLHDKFLQWLEVLSCLDAVRSIPESLYHVAKWLPDQHGELKTFAMDCGRFVAAFHDPISQSAPHIYLSALSFAPSNSKVLSHYRPLYPNALSVLTGKLENWPRDRLIIRQHTGSVRCVCFYSISGGGRDVGFITASADGTIRWWDTYTGRSLQQIRVQNADRVSVLSVAVSATQTSRSTDVVAFVGTDGICRLSFSDNSIRRQPVIVELPRHRPTLNLHQDFLSMFGTRVTFARSRDTECLVYNYRGELLVYTMRYARGTPAAELLPQSKTGNDLNVLCYALADRETSEPYLLIATSHNDQNIRLWDIVSGNRLFRSIRVDSKMIAMDLARRREEETRLVATDGEKILIYNVVQSVHIMTMDTRAVQGDFRCIAIQSDGARVVAGSTNAVVVVWDADSGKLLFDPLEGHRGAITSVALTIDGTEVASTSEDCTVRVWEVRDPKPKDELDTGGAILSSGNSPSSEVSTITHSYDGRRIIAGFMNGAIHIWDTAEMHLLQSLSHDDSVTSIATTSDGTLLASAGYGRVVHVWDLRTGRKVLSPLIHSEQCESVECVAFFPDNARLVSGDNVGQAFVWDLGNGQASLKLTLSKDGRAVRRSIRAILVSSDGSRIVGAAGDKIHLWDASSGALLTEFPRGLPALYNEYEEDELGYLDVPAGDMDDDMDSDITTPDDSEQWERELEDSDESDYHANATDFVYCLAISPDGSRIVSGGRRTIRLWDGVTGQPLPDIHVIDGHTARVRSVAFFPNVPDQFLSVSSDKSIRVWSVSDGRCIFGPMESSSPICAAAVAPDGTSFVTGSKDGTVRMWECNFTIGEGFNDVSVSVKFSLDGKRFTDTPQVDLRHRVDKNGRCRYAFVDVDSMPVFEDESKMEDGWVLSADGKSRLFWVPPQSRAGLWWPRNTSVIAPTATTRIDTSKFYHGYRWTMCQHQRDLPLTHR
ncbi:hypothetical protein K474DRAFT_1668455 [Panus rudis PR-1116 ss-1]|nr:hypothetical protein K474DRAFT_1668455 [Panus rudis PR-1116 ss-1]